MAGSIGGFSVDSSFIGPSDQEHREQAAGGATTTGQRGRVELELDPDGRATGSLARPNVRGEEKANRLHEWLDGRAIEEMWAYGNSSGDEALLAMSHHPTWIGKRATSH